MWKIALFAPMLVPLVGCMVVASDNSSPPPQPSPPPPPPAPSDYAPWVDSAEAGVYWDGGLRDDVWYFQAAVDDSDGIYDVNDVWADVYDASTDTYIQSFELWPTNDPYTWYSDWRGSTTYLDPWYDGYSVDIVVYDGYGATGYTTVWATSY